MGVPTIPAGAAPGTLDTAQRSIRARAEPRTPAGLIVDGPIPAPHRTGACSASTALPPGRPVIATQGRRWSTSPARLLRAERGDQPVRHRRHSPRVHRPLPGCGRRDPHRGPRRGAPAAGRRAGQRGSSHLRRARRPRGDRARAGRGRHRTHLRHPGADPAARAGRRRHHRPGPHRHGQDAGLRRAAAAADHPAGGAAGRGRRRRGRRPHRVPQALVVVPTRELCVQVAADLTDAGKHLGVRVTADLRRAGLRAADRRAAQGRRRGRRHPRPAARPGRAAPPGARPGQGAGARRGRRDARPGLPARRRADPADAAGAAAHDAVLGHHAGPDHHAVARRS